MKKKTKKANKNNLKRQRVEAFLKEYKPILNIIGFERIIDIPIGTIQKFLSNERAIDNERISKIDKFLFDVFNDYEEDSE